MKLFPKPEDGIPLTGQRSGAGQEETLSLLKENFDFVNSHLRPIPGQNNDILSKCVDYGASDKLRELEIYPFFKEVQAIDGGYVIIDGERMISLASADYLGLARDPRVISAAKKALEEFGIGCTGSRLHNGTLTLHRTLENELSAFLGREDTIVMSTGFQANQGTISCLLGKKDIAFFDQESHASIYEGCSLGLGKSIRYRHNDMDHLEYCLNKYSDVDGKLIITDSVFSMSGDIADLPGIVKLARDHGARILLDEAHGLGVLGDQGKGAANYYGLEKEIDLYVCTFSKALGSMGGFVSAQPKVTEYIRHKAASFMFTAALAPASVAGVTTALDVMINEPDRQKRLHDNTTCFKKGLAKAGIQENSNLIPIIPIEIGDEVRTLYFARLLLKDGVFASVALSPAVRPANAIVRCSLTASHTPEDLNQAVSSFKKLGQQLGIISPKIF